MTDEVKPLVAAYGLPCVALLEVFQALQQHVIVTRCNGTRVDVMHLGLENVRDNLFDIITLIACALNIEFCSNANDVVFKSYTLDSEHSRTDYQKYTLKGWIHSQQIRLKATHQ